MSLNGTWEVNVYNNIRTSGKISVRNYNLSFEAIRSPGWTREGY